MAKRKGRWIQAAAQRMKEKGTEGAFGPATQKNIARGLAKGGLQAKRAQFAKNMRAIARKRKRTHGRS